MPLSCMPETDENLVQWWYASPLDYTTMPPRRRRCRCSSCGALLSLGDTVTNFRRWRPSLTDIEQRISGDEIMLASFWMCEVCSDLYYSLEEVGYCVHPDENMRDLVREHAELSADYRAQQASERAI